MTDGVYLSEAIDINDFKPNKINLINSNCGSGKSYFAIKDLPNLATNRSRVLYLTDSVAMKDFLGTQEECKIYNPTDDEILKGNIVYFNDSDNKIIVMTYAKMGLLLKRHPILFNNFEIIVCDEIHRIPQFIEWSKEKIKKMHPFITETEIASILTYECGAYLAADYIEKFAAGLDPTGKVLDKPKLIVALSATPAKAYAMFGQAIEDIRLKAQTRAFETLNTIYYTDLATTIRQLDPNSKVLFYIPRITEMQKSVELARSLGARAIGIWSVNNINHPMSEEQIRVRDYIVTQQELPPEYDFIFINAAYETSINIYGEIKSVVLHTREEDAQIQGRNRVRGDIYTSYVLADNSTVLQVKLPIEYINVYLDKEKKQELCNFLNVTLPNGQIAGWTTTKRKLIEMGYKVKTCHPRIKGKQTSCDVITLQGE